MMKRFKKSAPTALRRCCLATLPRWIPPCASCCSYVYVGCLLIIYQYYRLKSIKMFLEAKDEDKSECIKRLTVDGPFLAEPVGGAIIRVWLQSRKVNSDLSQQSCGEVLEEEDDDDDSMDDIEIDDAYLRSLDPKEYKNQDHYKVLGVGKARFNASNDQIKRAYRKMVLIHHPDKRRSRGEKVRDAESDYFTCITKAYEILGNVPKRLSYDSVDPEFDDFVPVSQTNNSNKTFYETFGPVFARNARWSTRQPVPELGDKDSSFEFVDRFYTFWYNFDSWREYSYLDEEEKEKGESREERRWIEKQNRVARQKKKKEEMTRLRQLVDNAYSCDPRVQCFKEEEKRRKLEQKQAKQEAIRARALQEEKRKQDELEAQRLAKEKELEEAREKMEADKRAKEVIKKALKKERKTLRNICKEHDYFADSDANRVNKMADVEKLCDHLSLQSLQELNGKLSTGDAAKSKEIFLRSLGELNEKLQKEREAEMLALSQKTSGSQTSSSNQKQWSHDDLQLLVKAVNIFPAGTNQRWEVVAGYVNQHSSMTNSKRTAKEVLAKAKDLQKLDPSMKEEVNKQAFHKFEKTQKPATAADESAPTERFESAAEALGLNPTPWTAEEQQLLEQALKTYSSVVAERWDKIAACIPNRSKKDCMKRYKDLVEMVKAKKAVQSGEAKSRHQS